jgi:Tfp pilus assembly protein PilX
MKLPLDVRRSTATGGSANVRETTDADTRRRSASRRRPRRRGVAVLIVLAILAITLALSYSVMRSQVTAVQIQSNAMRRDDARQAAEAGMHIALRRMHEATWGGADSSFSGQLGTNLEFTATYTTGDDSLTDGDDDYHEWPYRVTITSTGCAADPANPQLQATHTVRAVVQVARRRRAAQPAGWSTVQGFTVYQWKPSSDLSLSRFIVEYPSRIEGRVRLQGELKLCDLYPGYTPAAERLMGDLNARRSLGLGDARPLTGPIAMKYSYTSSSVKSLLWNYLSVSTSDVGPSTAADWHVDLASSTYRLYSGGREYAIADVGGVLENVTLTPDPKTNPLGIFYHAGQLEIRDNVRIRGTLVVVGDAGAEVYIDGRNVVLEGADLAPLAGAAAPEQLPVLVSGNDLSIRPGSTVAVNGMVIVDDEFEVEQDDQNAIVLSLRGRLMCKELVIHGRNEWDQSSSWYESRLNEFNRQLLGLSPTWHFPDFLEKQNGLVVQPKIVIQGPATSRTYHWQDPGQPLLAPHDNDDSLVWDLIAWGDAG